MNYIKLNELVVPAYDTQTDETVANTLNAPVVMAREMRLTNLAIIKLLGVTRAKTLFDALKTAASNDSVVEFSIKDMGNVGIDINDVNAQAMLQSFVDSTLIEPAIKDVLANAANYVTTIAEQNGFKFIQPEDVRIARAQ